MGKAHRLPAAWLAMAAFFAAVQALEVLKPINVQEAVCGHNTLRWYLSDILPDRYVPMLENGCGLETDPCRTFARRLQQLLGLTVGPLQQDESIDRRELCEAACDRETTCGAYDFKADEVMGPRCRLFPTCKTYTYDEVDAASSEHPRPGTACFVKQSSNNTNPHVISFYRTSPSEVSFQLAVVDSGGKEVYPQTPTTLPGPGRRLSMAGGSCDGDDDESCASRTFVEVAANTTDNVHSAGLAIAMVADGTAAARSVDRGSVDRTVRRPYGRPQAPARRGKGFGGGGYAPGTSVTRGGQVAAGSFNSRGFGSRGFGYSTNSMRYSYPRGYRSFPLGYTGIGLAAGTMFLLPMAYASRPGYHHYGRDYGDHSMVSMDSDVTRDDLMVTGFAPASHSFPLVFTVSGLRGIDYTNLATSCDGVGQPLTQTTDLGLFISITQAQVLDETSLSDWLVGNAAMICISCCCIVYCCYACGNKSNTDNAPPQPWQPQEYQGVPMQAFPVQPGQQPFAVCPRCGTNNMVNFQPAQLQCGQCGNIFST